MEYALTNLKFLSFESSKFWTNLQQVSLMLIIQSYEDTQNNKNSSKINYFGYRDKVAISWMTHLTLPYICKMNIFWVDEIGA